MLAALALAEGAVTVDHLTEMAWGARPPADPKAAVETCVSRLRQALPEGQRVVYGGGGYRLDLADLALACLRAGDVAAATQEAEASLQLAETSDDRCAIARTRNLLAVISRRQGALAMARQHVQASLEVVGVDDDERVAALNTLTLVLLDAGEHDAAIATAREALEAGRAHGDRHHEAALLNNLADGLHASGRTSDALELQRQAAEAFAGVGDDPARHSEIWRLVDW